MDTNKYELLRDRFRKVFEAKWDREELDNFDELREKFAFHMADIAEQLASFAQVFGDAGECDVSCVNERTELFFNHCVPHLMAAAQVYDEIPQIFEEQKGVHDWNSFTDNEVG